jgi:hypothetical protein
MSDTPAIIASGFPGNREDAHRAGITIAARMGAVDSNEIRRWTIVIALSFLFAAAFTNLEAVYAHKFYDITGHAQWIWPRVEMASENPLVFFATRDFDLPATRYYTHIKIAADPEYTLYLNGQQLASKRMTEASALDVYDVSALARDGHNRIVAAVRSVNGAGGLLVAVDISPETENFVVTDRSWKIVSAQTSFTAKTRLPEVKVVSGTPIASTRTVRAFGYDFGWLDGQARLVRSRDIELCQVIDIRYANAKEELLAVEGKTHAIVFAPGESAVVDPDTRHFRWIGVYGRSVRADVVVAH